MSSVSSQELGYPSPLDPGHQHYRLPGFGILGLIQLVPQISGVWFYAESSTVKFLASEAFSQHPKVSSYR